MAEPTGTRLNSWKEIARHLRRDVRTARRWERERGMPVHRVPGGGGASVFAFAEEIDRWLAGEAAEVPATAGSGVQSVESDEGPIPTSPLTAPTSAHAIPAIVLLALPVVLLVVLIGFPSWEAGTRRPVHRLTLSGNTIHALDDRGGHVWDERVNVSQLIQVETSRWTFVSEPDEAGDQMIVVAADAADVAGVQDASLFAFHADGRQRWRVTAGDRLQFASGEYGPSWTCAGTDFTAFTVDGGRRFAWVVQHLTWWPSIVLVLDDEGAIRSRFVNSGWLRRVEPTPDGRYLAVAGVSNSADGAILAAFDPRMPSATSPERDGSPYACQTCPAGRPALYLLFPRSPLSVESGFRLLPPSIGVVDNHFQVRVPEGAGDPAPETIYEISPRFELLRASRSDGYREALRRLPARGAPGARWKEDDAPDVRVWHPDRGWTTERPAHPAATTVEATLRR